MNIIEKEVMIMQNEMNELIPNLLTGWTPDGVLLATGEVVHYRLKDVIVRLQLVEDGVKLLGIINPDGTEHEFKSVYYRTENSKDLNVIRNTFNAFFYALDKRRNRGFVATPKLFAM